MSETKINLDNLDVVFLLDKSGSMGDPYKNNMSRWKAAEETVSALAKEMAAHDDDGITIVPFNDGFEIIDGVTGDTVGEIFKKHSPGSGTVLGKPLQAVIDKFIPEQRTTAAAAKSEGFFASLGSMFGGSSSSAPTTTVARNSPKKPVCIVVATDGAAQDEMAVVDVICNATKRINTRLDLGILFIQVGSDPAAEKFLARIDSELQGRGADHDIVARCKLEDVEDKSTVELLTLAYTA